MKKFLKHLIVALGLLVHVSVFAEDIDLFVGSSAAEVPNILIVMDNTANWSSAFNNEKAALVSLINGLANDKYNVGLMMYSESGAGNSGNDGAYVRAALRRMNSSTKPLYAEMFNNLDVNADKSNSNKMAKAMQEAYLYMTGGVPYGGNGKAKTDYTGNISGNLSSAALYALPTGDALSSRDAVRYNNPVLPGCAKNFIIYLSNGPANVNQSDNDQATSALAAAGGSTTIIPLVPSGSEAVVADEWARFIRNSPIAASIYTIEIDRGTNNSDLSWTALLKSMSAQSAGRYFSVSSGAGGSEISTTLNRIFNEIQDVNSVFASVSLPLSVNNQGSLLNQVYVGMFRPDQTAAPRWAGNLKQYKLGTASGSVVLQDADGVNAVNSTTGFVQECARSYWTPAVVDTEWSPFPRGLCLTVPNSRLSNYPDGNIVEKGAQAMRLRSTTTRTVKTCNPLMASCTSLSNFDNTNVSQTMLGASSTTERDALINWARGLDVQNEDQDAVTTGEMRLSVHGDVLHSRPAAVNFGTAAAPQIVVFYGSNDGMLRAVNGNQTASIGTVEAGGELWSFMPPEFYPQIKRLYDNNVPISFPNSPGGGLPKPYGMDGPITSFKGLVGGVNKNFLYASMRRGGRAVYGFDVTDTLTAPNSPVLKWKIGCPNKSNDTDCTAGMSGVGQTWSAPQVMAATGYSNGAVPLLLMGGGYDNCEDNDALSVGGANHSCTATSKGNKLYVIDANTGTVVKTFNTDRGVIAEPVVISDANGLAKYAYAADLGGNVYRMSFGAAANTDWSITKIAFLGCETVAPCVANRKFMFTPSVVANGDVYTILLGSGDREKPIDHYKSSGAVRNHFFTFIDKPTVAVTTWPGAQYCGSLVICKDSLLAITNGTTPTAAQLASKQGWYLTLAATEQVVTAALTVFDTVAFNTQQPTVSVAGSCLANLGTARAYNVAFSNGGSKNGTTSPFLVLPANTGLPPEPTGGAVIVDGVKKIVCFSCGAAGVLPPKELSGGAAGSSPKGRLYWYKQK